MIIVTVHTKQGSTELQCKDQAEVERTRARLVAEGKRRGMTVFLVIGPNQEAK